jgi:enterochelin esterase-like enzyme
MNKVIKYVVSNYSFNLILILFGFFITTDCSKEHSELPSAKELMQSDFLKFVKEMEALEPENRSILINRLINLHPVTPVIEDSSLAILYWYGKAETLLINGDIQNAWSSPDTMNKISCGDSSFFYKIYSLPPEARLDYLLIVDGKEILDPRNKFKTPSGYGEHSQLAMPMFKSDSVLLFNKNILCGSLDTLVVHTKNLSGGKRNLIIYKPFNYASSNEFPVMYVNDGYKALSFSSYKNVLDNLIADKKIKPILSVFIKFEEGDQDYFLNSTGKYISFLCDELVPFIDSKFKTSRLSENRTVSGISAGGNISLLTPIIRPDVFSKGAGQSSTVTDELLEQVSNLSSTGKYKNHKFYFDVGIYDLNYGSSNVTSFFDLNQSLLKEFNNKIDHRFQTLIDGHQWANWRERADEILIYFFGNSLISNVEKKK